MDHVFRAADHPLSASRRMVFRYPPALKRAALFQDRYLPAESDHGIRILDAVLYTVFRRRPDQFPFDGFISEPYKFLSNTGSARGLIAAMNCLMWFGNTTILLMAGMMGIDTSLFEASEVDGATSTQVFFKITLPLLRPILIYVMITSLIGGLQLFDVPQILTNGTGDPMRTTMTLIMFLNKHLFSKNYGMAGALSVLLFIITAVLSLIIFKVTGNDKRKG